MCDSVLRGSVSRQDPTVQECGGVHWGPHRGLGERLGRYEKPQKMVQEVMKSSVRKSINMAQANWIWSEH